MGENQVVEQVAVTLVAVEMDVVQAEHANRRKGQRHPGLDQIQHALVFRKEDITVGQQAADAGVVCGSIGKRRRALTPCGYERH